MRWWERVRWVAVLVTLMCLAAAAWVVVDHSAYAAALTVIAAAAVITYLGKGADQ